MPLRNLTSRFPTGPFQLNENSLQARGLIGWWPLSVTGVKDLSNTSLYHSANNTGGATYTVDPAFGRILDFDGSNDRTEFGDVLDMGTNSFSVTMWAYAKSNLTTSGGGGRVVQKRGTGAFGSQAGWQIVFNRSGSNVRLVNAGIDDGSNSVEITSGEAVTIGPTLTWFHLTMIVDRVNDLWEFYANAAQIHTESSASVTGSVDNSRQLTFGASDVSSTQFASVRLADVRIYDRVLSTADMWHQVRPQTKFDLYEPVPRRFVVLAPAAPAPAAGFMTPNRGFWGVP